MREVEDSPNRCPECQRVQMDTSLCFACGGCKVSNKHSYAGLLERLLARRGLFAAAEKMAGIMGCRFTLNELGKQKAEEMRGQGELINPDGPEAAEAISSLLKALTEARVYVAEKADDAYSTREDDLLSVIDAALNSDAPLTNLTSSIQVSEEMPPCRFCGSKCRVENFNSEHVEATLWICGNSEYFGGNCPDQTVYLYEHAWQAAMRSKDHSIGDDVRERVSLVECPIGLFWHDDTLCLKTEYGNNEGRIDAYIVESGEFYWGDAPQTIASQRAQLVTPIDTDQAIAAITAIRSQRPAPNKEGNNP